MRTLHAFCLLAMVFLLGACTPNGGSTVTPALNESLIEDYIYEDQGAEPGDTTFAFQHYPIQFTDDEELDYLTILEYMSNYFGYVFDGATGKEIPQSGWVQFLSKPGHGMRFEFMDLDGVSGAEIVQYSISGQRNNTVHLDILSFKGDSLHNVFSEIISRPADGGGLACAALFQSDDTGFQLHEQAVSLGEGMREKPDFIIKNKKQSTGNGGVKRFVYDSGKRRFLPE